MTTYTVGSGGDYANFAAIDWAGTLVSGDVVELLNDFTEEMTIPNGTDGVTVDLNGFTIDAESARDRCIEMTDVCDNMTIRNGRVTGGVLNNIRWGTGANAGTTIRYLTLENITGGNVDTITGAPPEGDGTGILVVNSSYGAFAGKVAAISHVTILNCEQSGCGRHGFDFRGNIKRTLKGLIARNNGSVSASLAAGGHGVTLHPWRVEWPASSGLWDAPAGSVYSRTEQSTDDVIAHVTDNTNKKPFFENTATPTTPAAGEWGYSGTKLYLRMHDSSDPDAAYIQYLRVEYGPIAIWDAQCSGTLVDGGGGEGHGFSFDSVSYQVNVYGGRFHDNEGVGIMAVKAKTCQVVGALLYDNDSDGIRFQSESLGCSTYNVTTVRAGRDGLRYGAARAATAINVISANSVGVNINCTSDAQTTRATNASFNGGSADVNAGVTVTDDPEFISTTDLRLNGSSPCLEAGTRWWGTDPPPQGQDGLMFSRVPAMGAYQPRPDDGATRSPLVLSAAASVYDAGVDIAKVQAA